MTNVTPPSPDNGNPIGPGHDPGEYLYISLHRNAEGKMVQWKNRYPVYPRYYHMLESAELAEAEAQAWANGRDVVTYRLKAGLLFAIGVEFYISDERNGVWFMKNLNRGYLEEL